MQRQLNTHNNEEEKLEEELIAETWQLVKNDMLLKDF